MNIEKHLKNLYEYFKAPDKQSLEKSLNDVHHKGIFSLVIHGHENGKLTRVFISDVELKPFEVQLHSHRYPLRITVLNGEVRHYMANYSDYKTAINMSTFKYKSPLNGGNGLTFMENARFKIVDSPLPVGSVINLSENDIHTMSCSKGSIWVVEEMGFKTDSSIVVGVPFITDDLYNEPKQFQINDNFSLVKKTLKNIINHYDIAID